jgi:HAD superfamily hydrolase (TIGR01509 family)
VTRPDAPSTDTRVEAVVFDWYATLGRPLVDGWWEQLRGLIVASGGTIDEDAIRWWQNLPVDHLAASSSQATYDAWIADRFRALLRSSSVPEERIPAAVAESESIRASELVGLVDGALAAVETLRAAGVAVGVCSNWDWDLDRHLAQNGISEHFDLVVCSAIVGYRKPHRSIFDVVVDGLGRSPASILFVGDDLEADIEGATAVGMRPVHAAWATPCLGGHADSVACCATFDDLLALPALTGRVSTEGP